MHIRKAIQADAASLKELDTVVAHDPTKAERIDEWLEHDEVLVAELENKIVGYGVYNHAFFRQGQVDMLMIHSDYRRQKIGEQLLIALEQLCTTPKFWVTTNLSNQRMQRLLSRLGFKLCGYIDELDLGDPELVFVKLIARHNLEEKP